MGKGYGRCRCGLYADDVDADADKNGDADLLPGTKNEVMMMLMLRLNMIFNDDYAGVEVNMMLRVML